MPARYFGNTLADFTAGTSAAVNPQPALQSFKRLLDAVLGCRTHKPSVYTGAAGIAYALWHAARHAPWLASVASEEALLSRAERFARAALEASMRQPLERHGWSLLVGHAGVYCVGALVLAASAGLAERQGQQVQAAQLRQEQRQRVQQFTSLHCLACSSACQEDEVLYGRSGYLMGCLLLNKQLQPDSVPSEVLQEVVRSIIQSGRSLAGRLRDRTAFPTPLLYLWPPGPDASPYLGAAHGLMGILFALLHVPELVAAVPGAQQDVQAALQCVMALECDAEGQPGPGGHYPSQMGPWRDREPLVHWCHGATGAVFLLCKAYEQLGGAVYLAAAKRGGEAVWQRGLLKKGPGCCHGISGSAYALLRLYRTTGQDKWLHRAVQFAEYMNSEEFQVGARTPDHPLSLFEGSAAALCLWADLLGDPQTGGFPMFEVDI